MATATATNSTTAVGAAGVHLLHEVATVLWATRAELFLFCAAVVAYWLLFGDARPRATHAASSKAKRLREKERETDGGHGGNDGREDDATAAAARSPAARSPLSSSECDQVERDIQDSFEAGDHREVLRGWASCRRFGRTPKVHLPKVVEAMRRFRKDPAYVCRELKGFFARFPDACDIESINDVLEALSRRLDSDLTEKIMDLLPSVHLRPDQRTYEVLLSMHFMTRSFQEVRRLVAEMQSLKVPLTARATIVVVKTALKTGNFAEATRHFRTLRAAWERPGTEGGPRISTAPQHIVSQLVELACKDHQLAEFLPLLEGMPLTNEAVCAMLMESARQKDLELARAVERLARSQQLSFSEASFAALVRGHAADGQKVQRLFDEIVANSIEPTTDLAMALLGFCAQTGAVGMAERLFEYMRPKQLPVLSGFIRFYAEHECFERACDVYERHVVALRFMDSSPSQQLPLDARMERCLLNAALRCGRQKLAQTFLEASPADVAKHIAMIRSCAAAGNLKGAIGVFEALRGSGVELNSVVYNTVLDACVECRDLVEAEAWMELMKLGGFTDVVSYNTLIKAHLQSGNFTEARALMELMRAEGVQPNRVTYNELVNGLVRRGTSAQRPEVWAAMEEMQAAGVKPNQVTCSILLKNLNARSAEEDVRRTMDLISSVEEPMDEVLLSSVVEACVRIGQPDLLSSTLKQLQGDGTCAAVSGSHTFGSLIKAYGHAKDIDGVWRCWKEMRSRHIRPSSITLGCMVEAVVSNGDTEGAYELIHQMQEDERCRDALNSVIYCSVLKGFCREKKLQRVWAVYQEMLDREVDLSVVTYNTLIDACARCGRMDRVPEIVADMKSKGIRPNLITYSTMLKGHCQLGDIHKGFAIVQQMRRETDLKPDEIMYNSLLDGCAQNSLVDEGLSLLSQMQQEGVQPSNFTLSLLVKLMSRARKLEGAFTLVEEVARRHSLRPNVHVHTNLIQACITNRQLPRALQTFETMLGERIQPENRTYLLLVRASISQGQTEQAAALLRGALGLDGSLPSQARAKAVAACGNLDYAFVGEALQGLTDAGAQHLSMALLSDIKQYLPRVRIDAAVQRRVRCDGSSQDAACANSHRYGAGYGTASPSSSQQRRPGGGASGGARSGRQ